MRYRVKSHGPLPAVRTQTQESVRGCPGRSPGHHRMMIATNSFTQSDLGVSPQASGDGR